MVARGRTVVAARGARYASRCAVNSGCLRAKRCERAAAGIIDAGPDGRAAGICRLRSTAIGGTAVTARLAEEAIRRAGTAERGAAGAICRTGITGRPAAAA